jgi:hypothetical protein
VSYRPRPKARDKAEPLIVQALQAIGASVQRLDADTRSGVPDLLVGFRGVNVLLEVKNPEERSSPYRVKSGEVRETTRSATTLKPEQERWHRAWRGLRPLVVRTPQEALAAVGAPVKVAGHTVPAPCDDHCDACDAQSLESPACGSRKLIGAQMARRLGAA